MHPLYLLPTQVHSRSISFENPTGEKGAGGSASSPIGPGRKGSPARMLEPGSTVELANIRGSGVLRHIWAATYDVADTMRGLVVRIYWEGQQHPSVEAPIGDFFGFAHGKTTAFQTAMHSVGEKYALNSWVPMPFSEQARVTISNDLDITVPFFFQIDYTIGDSHPPEFGRLHTMFRRENPTTKAIDFELLPKRTGRGRYLGTVIGVRPDNSNWWGEGEVKMFIDGDQQLATIVGTGAEDYAGLSWGLQQNAFLYHGATLVEGPNRINTGPVSMYRWHVPDPIYWYQDIVVTVQQIGLQPPIQDYQGYQEGLYDRQDDWSACTFWYEAVPSEPVPGIPSLAKRLAGLDLCPDRATLPLQPGCVYNSNL